MRNRSVQLAVVETNGRFLGIVTLTDVIKRVLPTAPAA
nr:CBS domain-containing protein [Rhodococcus sp. BS-15]